MTATTTTTPDARGAWRRAQTWLWLAAALLASAAVSFLTLGSLNQISGKDLDPASPAPNGARAVYQVLGQHGVDTEQASSFAEVTEKLDARPTTLVVHDRNGMLDEQLYQELPQLGRGLKRIVLLMPQGAGFGLADAVSSYAGTFTAPHTADAPEEASAPESFVAGAGCPLAPLAPTIPNLGGQEFVPIGEGSGCYRVRDGEAIVFGKYHGVELVVVGTGSNLTNEFITEDANAAMALNVLGSTERLIWYVPGADDLAAGTALFSDYVPPWLTPVMLLLGAVGLACVFWRGRRFGPLVAEQLPVTVPASETIEGRAVLYDRAAARLHALDGIRIGTLTRLAELLGLGRNAPAEAIADATAQIAAVPREQAWRVLLVAEPANDTELVALANAAAELEQRVRAATGRAQPRTNPPQQSAKRHRTNTPREQHE